MPILLINLSHEEVAVIDRWRLRYLSPDMDDSLEGATRDMLRRLEDDMHEMEEQERQMSNGPIR